ncbi:hypothetical protein Esti_003962 [Eimeria stiedai]
MIPLRIGSHTLLKAFAVLFVALGAQPRNASCSEIAPLSVGTGVPLAKASYGGPLNALTRIQDVGQHNQDPQLQSSALTWGNGGESGGQPINFLHNDAEIAAADSAASGAAAELPTAPASGATAAPVVNAAPAVQQTRAISEPPVQEAAPTVATAVTTSASNSLASSQTTQQAVASATPLPLAGTPSQASVGVPSVPATAAAAASTPAKAAEANPAAAPPGAAGAQASGPAVSAMTSSPASAQPIAEPLSAGASPTPFSPSVPLAVKANSPLPIQGANSNLAPGTVSPGAHLNASASLPSGQSSVAPIMPVAAAVSAEAPLDAKVAEATTVQSAQAQDAATQAAAAEAPATQKSAADAAAAQAAAAQAAAAQAAAVQPAAAQAAAAAQAQMLQPSANPASSTVTSRHVDLHYDSDVCLDQCSCWPVWAMSIVVFCFYFTITFIAFYMTASLYSQASCTSP